MHENNKFEFTSGIKGLRQPPAIKRFCRKYIIYPIVNLDNKTDVIFKLRKNKYKKWYYVKFGDYQLTYGLEYGLDGKPKSEIVFTPDINNIEEISYGCLFTKRFMVTHNGVVIDRQNRKVLKTFKNGAGYLYFSNGKSAQAVHRLVADVFVKLPKRLQAVDKSVLPVNHIDGNKTNNHYTNLEWCTNSENAKKAYETGLNLYKGDAHHMVSIADADIPQLRKRYYESGLSINDFAKINSMSSTGMSLILRNISRKDEDYKPDFEHIKKSAILIGEDKPQAKLTKVDVNWMRADYVLNNNTYMYYAKKFGVSKEAIKLVLRNRSFFDPNYEPPKSRTKTLTFEDAKWIRKHYKYNLNTPFEFYCTKFNISNSTVSQVVNNKLHYDPLYEPIKDNKREKYSLDFIKTFRQGYLNSNLTIKDYASIHSMSMQTAAAIIYNESYFDPLYTPPAKIGCIEITSTQVKEMRLHKIRNPKTRNSYYCDKYSIGLASVGKILNNKSHYDPNYEPLVKV